MKTNLLKKTTLLIVALLAMGGSKMWADAGDNNIAATGESTINLSTIILGGSYDANVGYDVDKGYLDNFHKGEGGSFNVTVASAGAYVVDVQYGSSANPTLSFTMGEAAKTLALSTTGGWTSWQHRRFLLHLTTEMTSLVLNWTETDNVNNYTANIKSITFQPVSEAVDHTISSSVVSLDNTKAVMSWNSGDGIEASKGDLTNIFGKNIPNNATAVFDLYNTTAQKVQFAYKAATGNSGGNPTVTFDIYNEDDGVVFTSGARNVDYTDSEWKNFIDNHFYIASLPAGLLKLKITFNCTSGYVCNMGDEMFTPYSVLVDASVNINEAKELINTLAISTDGLAFKDGEHNRDHVFANAANGKTVKYQLYSENEQEVLISGEGASNASGKTLTFSFEDEEGNITSYTTKSFTSSADWKTWTPYSTKFTLPAGVSILKVISNNDGGVNFTAPTITPYSALAEAATEVTDMTTLTREGVYATTGTIGDGHENLHGKSVTFFANPSNGATATYKLYFPTAMYVTISGEWASGNGTSTHTLAYSFTSDENDALTAQNFSVTSTGEMSDWDDWKPYSSAGNTILLEGLITMTITYTKSGTDASNQVNYLAPTISPLTVSYTILASGVGTYCSPYKLDFSETGATPYIITGDISEGKITATSVDGVVPANTGIIVKGTAGEISIPVSTKTPAVISGNKLVGVTEATDITRESGYDYYVMNNGELWKVDENGTIAANRAYLKIEKGGSAHSLSIDFSDGETTSISEKLKVKSEKLATATEYFDLQGRRVAQPVKGLYIVNGKKVIIK